MKLFRHAASKFALAIIIVFSLLGIIFSFVGVSAQTPAPSPGLPPTPSPSASALPSPGSSATPSPSASATPSLTPIPTPSPMPSPKYTPAPVPVPNVTLSAPGSPPPESTQNENDWPLPNHDYGNTRASKTSSINSTNINTLGAAWVHNVPSGQSTFGSMNTTPLIIGDTAYIQDIGNNVIALDLATGQQKWQTVYNLTNLGPNGVAAGYGKLFASAGPYDVVALDMNTGKEVWRTTLINAVQDISLGVNGIDMQPTVYDGMVYIATVPGNAGVFYAGGGMGIIYALDANTGNPVWSFNTVYPVDWVTSQKNINSGGGCWYSPAIDTSTGVIYWGIANPGPFPGQTKGEGISQDWPNGTSRPGPNLYTCSMTAFDHTNGNMFWYNQVWPHDIADYDLQIAPILGTANYGGKDQNIVIGAGKMGRVYAFNSQSGALIWTTNVGQHNGNDELSTFPTDGTITVMPGSLGGVETPMSYADNVVYVIANNLAIDYTNGLTFKLHDFKENTSDLVAIDVNTGHILWDKTLPSGGYGGTTVVNDLVFTGTYDGTLYAFNRTSGQQVWTYQAPAGINAWPAVAGDTIVWPIAGPGGPASVIGFKLGSTGPAVKIASPTDRSNLPAGDVTVQPEVTNFNLVDKIGQPNAPGEGHLVYYLDMTPPSNPGQSAVPSSGTYFATAANNYTFKNVAAGSHTIAVQLVNNDNTALTPPVTATVNVTLDNNPRISITNPKNGAIRKSGSIAFSAEVSNFNLTPGATPTPSPGASPSPTSSPSPSVSPSPQASPSPAASPYQIASPTPAASPTPSSSPTPTTSPAPAAPQGQIIYYMDVAPPTVQGQSAIPASGVYAVSSSTSYTFNNVSPGIHTFYVQLVNSDNTPLSNPVTDSIQLFAINYTGGAFQQ
jgi:outer membrane protein assembly factor BamB